MARLDCGHETTAKLAAGTVRVVYCTDEGAGARGRIARLAVTLNGEDIDMPGSAYADLDEVAETIIEDAPGGFRVQIRGGDAGGAYTVVLTFTPDRLTGRTLAGETGDVVQRTTYLMPVVT
ncbi:MAG: hypothetical protein JWR84_3660 [Caulobacter sp.]|nr:hypothetical protein [Caulobacter sp.]